MELKEIKEVRKKVGMTQFELAKKAGVSQSLIAKVESGLLDPTYTNATKIFNALSDLSQEKELKAENIMNQKIISIAPGTSIKDAIGMMRKNGFSQLPVISDHKAVGLITENAILNALIEKKGNTVADIMENAPPVISSDAPVSAISGLLKYFQMVLVSKKGNLVGVITKTDLLAKVY